MSQSQAPSLTLELEASERTYMNECDNYVQAALRLLIRSALCLHS